MSRNHSGNSMRRLVVGKLSLGLFVAVALGGGFDEIEQPQEEDSIAPGDISEFRLEAGDGMLILSWKNPHDTDFMGTRILRKVEEYSDSYNDGAKVYDGGGESVIDEGLVNGTEYFYSGFAYDTTENFSSGSTVIGTPTGFDYGDAPTSGSGTGSDPFALGGGDTAFEARTLKFNAVYRTELVYSIDSFYYKFYGKARRNYIVTISAAESVYYDLYDGIGNSIFSFFRSGDNVSEDIPGNDEYIYLWLSGRCCDSYGVDFEISTVEPFAYGPVIHVSRSEISGGNTAYSAVEIDTNRVYRAELSYNDDAIYLSFPTNPTSSYLVKLSANDIF